MKMLKRVTALFLCFLMLNSGPLNAFATEDGSGNDAGCTGCTQTEGHLETCSKYEAPVEDIAETAGPQVGDKIWIKHDSYVYKSQSAETGHKLLLNYEVEIVSIITNENGNAVWYEFEPNGALALFYKDYKYVQVENTSVEEPEATEPADENTCNCGENAPENIADHADSCPRKQYIKTLFEGKTAEEIYGEWENYDEATQNDLLNMLQKWDNAKYEELKNIVSGASTEQIVDDMKFTSEIPVVISEAEAEEVERIEEILPAVEECCIRESFVYDISGEDQDGVKITVSGMIDIQKLNEYGRCFVDVYHLKDNGEIEILCGAVDWEGNVTFETDSFSTFYFLVQYYANNGTYTLNMNSTATVATILKSCGVPTGFTITNVTADSGTVKDSDGNDIPWVTISNPQNNNTKVKLAGTFSGLHKLTVTTNKGTYTIDVAVPEVFYYLDGTDWCMNTTPEPFVLDTVDYGTRTTNVTQIGVTDVTGGIVIYVRPGMVIQFTNGWRWGPDEDNLYEAHVDYGGWRWCSANNMNYLIIDENITEVKTFTVQFSQSVFTEGRLQHGTTATVHVIPDYTPTLLETVDGVE